MPLIDIMIYANQETDVKGEAEYSLYFDWDKFV